MLTPQFKCYRKLDNFYVLISKLSNTQEHLDIMAFSQACRCFFYQLKEQTRSQSVLKQKKPVKLSHRLWKCENVCYLSPGAFVIFCFLPNPELFNSYTSMSNVPAEEAIVKLLFLGTKLYCFGTPYFLTKYRWILHLVFTMYCNYMSVYILLYVFLIK